MATTLALSSPIVSARCKATHTHDTHTHIHTVDCARHSGAKLLQMCISYQLGRQPAVKSRQSPSLPYTFPFPAPFSPPSLSLSLSPRGQLVCDLCAKLSSLSRTIRQSLPRFSCCSSSSSSPPSPPSLCCCCKGSRRFDLPFVYPLALPLRAFSGFTVNCIALKVRK